MDRSGHVHLRDLRACYRLVGECRELGDEPAAWRAHLLAGLSRLLGAQLGLAGEAQWLAAPGFFRTEPPVERGWSSPKARKTFYDYLQKNGPERDPVICGLARLRGRAVTRRRDQLIDDRGWYGSVHFNEYLRAAEIDACLHSIFPIDAEQRFNIVCFFRPVGDRGFGSRDSRLLHIFHAELGPLVGRDLVTESSDRCRGLGPRLRDTLACFLLGANEKETGRRLGISVYTVHQYAKALYRHFGVHSRGELLALWIARHPPGTHPGRLERTGRDGRR